MYCPQCGNRQVSDDIRFCVKCGLPLAGAAKMLSGRSADANLELPSSTRKLTPRARGVLQGVAIMPLAFGAWLALDIFYEAVFSAGMLGGLYAMLTFIVLLGLARILYAVFYEDGRTRHVEISSRSVEKNMSEAVNTNELPPADLSDDCSPDILRPVGEVIPHTSVTESTTRHLK